MHTNGENVVLNFPSETGMFTLHQFGEHVALVKGDVNREEVLVRVHSSCFTSEVLGSLRCDCRKQLQLALEMIEKEGGVLIYLQQEGRGIGLGNKLKAYKLQDQGLDTIEANHKLGFETDLREYSIVKEMFDSLGVKSIKLITNNPEKLEKVSSYVKIVGRVPVVIEENEHNSFYLQTKKDKMGHLLW